MTTTSFETRISNLHLTGGRIRSDAPVNIQVPSASGQAFTVTGGSQTEPLFAIDSIHNTIQLNAPTYINQPMFVRYLEEIDTLDHMPVFSGLEMGGWALQRDAQQITQYDTPISMTAKLAKALSIGILTSGILEINNITFPNVRLLQEGGLLVIQSSPALRLMFTSIQQIQPSTTYQVTLLPVPLHNATTDVWEESYPSTSIDIPTGTSIVFYDRPYVGTEWRESKQRMDDGFFLSSSVNGHDMEPIQYVDRAMGHISSSDGYSLLPAIDSSSSFSISMIPHPLVPTQSISQVESTQVKTQRLTTLDTIQFSNGAEWTCSTTNSACSLSAPLSVTSMSAQDYSITGATDFAIQQIQDPLVTESQLVSQVFSTISEARNMITDDLQLTDGGLLFGHQGNTETLSPFRVYSETNSSFESTIYPHKISAPEVQITGTDVANPILRATDFLQFKINNSDIGFFDPDGFNTSQISLSGNTIPAEDKVTNLGADDVTHGDIVLSYYGTALNGSWIVDKTFRQRLAQYDNSNNQWKLAWDQYQTGGWYRIAFIGS